MQVAFPAELDVYDFCTAELQQQLQPAREALRAYQDMLAQQKRTAKQLKTEDGPKPGPGAAEAAAAAGEAPAAAGGDVDMKDAETGASSSGSVVGALTGEELGAREGACIWVQGAWFLGHQVLVSAVAGSPGSCCQRASSASPKSVPGL
jgi:hypothetical protein